MDLHTGDTIKTVRFSTMKSWSVNWEVGWTVSFIGFEHLYLSGNRLFLYILTGPRTFLCPGKRGPDRSRGRLHQVSVLVIGSQSGPRVYRRLYLPLYEIQRAERGSQWGTLPQTHGWMGVRRKMREEEQSGRVGGVRRVDEEVRSGRKRIDLGLCCRIDLSPCCQQSRNRRTFKQFNDREK